MEIDLEQAEEEFQTLYHLTKGDDSPDTLHIRNSYAGVLHQGGKLERAKHMYRETLELRDEVLGPLHLHTLSTYRRLTRLLVEMGAFDEALPLLEELLRRHNERIGADAGLTLTVRTSLAATLEGLEEWEQAEAFRIATLRLHERRSDKKYASKARRQLADFYIARGQPEAAQRVMTEGAADLSR